MPAMSVVVARIGKPHSLRGEVTVQAHTDDPEGRFVPGAVFATEAADDSGVPRDLTIRTARVHNGVWLLSFEGIPDRTGAEGLRGTRLLLEREPPGPDGARADDDADEESYFEDDLVGLVAETVTGERLGTVAGLETGTAQDLLVLTLADGASAYVPFVAAIVPEVDLDGGRVVLDPPPGLLDLNRG
jgi:16S rRNA processing protein RimM